MNDFVNVIRALDQRVAQLELKFSKLSSALVETPVEAPSETPSESCAEAIVETPVEVPTETPVEINVEAVVEPPKPTNEVNLDEFSPDTIQNELWQTFKRISDSGMEVVVNYSGNEPRNIIVYASDETQPVYRNNGSGEMRIIQAIEGTLIATVQPGESVKTARVDGVWTNV